MPVSSNTALSVLVGLSDMISFCMAGYAPLFRLTPPPPPLNTAAFLPAAKVPS